MKLIIMMLVLSLCSCKLQNETQNKLSEDSQRSEQSLTLTELAALYMTHRHDVASDLVKRAEVCDTIVKACTYSTYFNTDDYEKRDAELKKDYNRKKNDIIKKYSFDKKLAKEMVKDLYSETKKEIEANIKASKEAMKLGSETTLIGRLIEAIRSTEAFSRLETINTVQKNTPDLLKRSVIASKLDPYFEPYLKGLSDSEIENLSRDAQAKLSKMKKGSS